MEIAREYLWYGNCEFKLAQKLRKVWKELASCAQLGARFPYYVYGSRKRGPTGGLYYLIKYSMAEAGTAHIAARVMWHGTPLAGRKRIMPRHLNTACGLSRHVPIRAANRDTLSA